MGNSCLSKNKYTNTTSTNTFMLSYAPAGYSFILNAHIWKWYWCSRSNLGKNFSKWVYKGKQSKNNPPSAVLKNLQLASVQFSPIKLSDGILQVTARCKLNHSVLKQKQQLVPNSEDKGHLICLTNRTTHPSFLLGLWASTKVTSPAFLIRSFRSCFKA